jgi:hypothetical protein
MNDFWSGSGFSLLRRSADGRLTVTGDYLRLYFSRPELAPVPESCDNERALHAALMAEPRRVVKDAEIAAIADPDAQENYRVMLRFRSQLLAAPDLEAFYFGLFRRDIAVPPDFIHHTVQVIVRGLLDGTDALDARAAEVFFREQRVTIQQGAVLLADGATVDMHAATGGFGAIGELLRQAQAPVRSVELDVLDAGNAEEYWKRDERFDTVLDFSPGGPGAAAFCRVLAAWIRHFHGAAARVTSIREIPDAEWVWHVGLDAEATAMLNDIYNGGEVNEERMKRIIGLFRIDFDDPSLLRAEVAGAPVFLGLAMDGAGRVRMKPQNLLVNLPLARSA